MGIQQGHLEFCAPYIQVLGLHRRPGTAASSGRGGGGGEVDERCGGSDRARPSVASRRPQIYPTALGVQSGSGLLAERGISALVPLRVCASVHNTHMHSVTLGSFRHHFLSFESPLFEATFTNSVCVSCSEVLLTKISTTWSLSSVRPPRQVPFLSQNYLCIHSRHYKSRVFANTLALTGRLPRREPPAHRPVHPPALVPVPLQPRPPPQPCRRQPPGRVVRPPRRTALLRLAHGPLPAEGVRL